MPPPAAILDVDGTLVDTNYHHAVAWYRALRQYGQVIPIWLLHRAIGKGGDQLVRSVTSEGWDAQFGDEARAAEKVLYMELIGEVAPLPGAADFVRLLVQDGHEGGFGVDELTEAGAVAVFESIADLREGIGKTPLRA